VVTKEAIRVEGLSKQYRLGAPRQRYPTLRETLTEKVNTAVERTQSKLLRRTASRDGQGNLFWALDDVSFEIHPGEVVGIIGRNGAGKTTLLKILSRITEPTRGWADITGRVGSLLEVGTGFHAELTGRENIYLNGAILGMRREEIARRFDDIVEFSELSRFLETPVKRYSSGMIIRLGFAISAHLEPEILLVDEVLAVGDTSFQRKCIDKMGQVSTEEGRTILFVSHNMAIMQALCQRGILLENGRVTSDDSMVATVTTYLQALERAVTQDVAERKDRRGWGQIKLVGLEISGEGGASLAVGRSARFVFDVAGDHPVTECAFTIYNQLGHPVATLDSANQGEADSYEGDTDQRCICEIDALPLLPGRYRIDAVIRGNGQLQDSLEGAAVFDVEEGPFKGRPISVKDGKPGDVALQHYWLLPRRSLGVL
jgi:lipopolysaccharide transport system ATP-binding protein